MFRKGQKTWVILVPAVRGRSLKMYGEPHPTPVAATAVAERLLRSGEETRVYMAEVYLKYELDRLPVKTTLLREM